jgi:hypothetical protein
MEFGMRVPKNMVAAVAAAVEREALGMRVRVPKKMVGAVAAAVVEEEALGMRVRVPKKNRTAGVLDSKKRTGLVLAPKKQVAAAPAEREAFGVKVLAPKDLLAAAAADRETLRAPGTTVAVPVGTYLGADSTTLAGAGAAAPAVALKTARIAVRNRLENAAGLPGNTVSDADGKALAVAGSTVLCVALAVAVAAA